MPLLSLSEAAARFGVTPRTVRRWVTLGAPQAADGRVDPDELRAWREGHAPAAKPSEEDDATFSELETQLLEAKVSKTQADAELAQFKRKLAEGDLVLAAKVREDELRRIAAVRAGLLALVVGLPPRLDGLTADEMRGVIQDAVHRLLEEYARGR